jgi:hypothetical protein
VLFAISYYVLLDAYNSLLWHCSGNGELIGGGPAFDTFLLCFTRLQWLPEPLLQQNKTPQRRQRSFYQNVKAQDDWADDFDELEAAQNDADAGPQAPQVCELAAAPDECQEDEEVLEVQDDRPMKVCNCRQRAAKCVA